MREEEIYNEYNELPQEEYEKIRYSEWSPKAFVLGAATGFFLGVVSALFGAIR